MSEQGETWYESTTLRVVLVCLVVFVGGPLTCFGGCGAMALLGHSMEPTDDAEVQTYSDDEEGDRVEF